MQKQERSRMLGEMDMKRLVPTVSVPIMISMLVQALYNVVDSIFVARYDANALAAISLAFPVQILMIAVCVGLGTGINSLISRRLGENRKKEARQAAWNGIFMEGCGAVLFLLFGIFGAAPVFRVFTQDAILREMGTTYISICTIGCLGLFMSIVFERMLQSTGNSRDSMITQMAGAITNIILDPLLIFGLAGLPRMGIAGAAVATVIGQWVSMGVGFCLNQKRNPELRLHLREFAVSSFTMGEILAVGFPGMIMQSISSVMNVLFNMILTPYGATAISVLGVYYKLQSFIFMPVFGLGNGLVAIVGYNYGARNKERVYSAIRVALVIAVCIMLVGTILFMTIPQVMMSLFEGENAGDLNAMGTVALRVISLHFLLATIGITLSTTFQALGKGNYSLIISLCRQVVVLIPAAWLLSTIFGRVDAIWWSFLAAEIMSSTMSLLMFRRVRRTMLEPLDGVRA